MANSTNKLTPVKIETNPNPDKKCEFTSPTNRIGGVMVNMLAQMEVKTNQASYLHGNHSGHHNTKLKT